MNAVHSELHNRLGKMVHYSSQLIFVSSESIAQQQRTLESFLAEQSEGTEIAFVTAKAEYDVRQYRRQLCQQLLGQVAGSYIRPLNELLESLNHHDGPVLIGIMQSHLLPNEFLQELWQLVLQSRFAANKQHLNIVLFGESKWAEQAQQWLPAKNTATPVLMSSETIMNQSSELDALIAQKRAAFQQRLADRENSLYGAKHNTPLVRSPWFSLMVIGVFIILFGGILWAQYPDKMQSLLGMTPEVQETLPTVDISEPPQAPVTIQPESILETPEVIAESDSAAIEQSVTDLLLIQQWAEPTEQAPSIQQNSAAEAPSPAISDTVETEQQPNTVSSESLPLLTAMPESLSEGFVVQLTGVKSSSLLEEFVVDNALQDSVWYYKTQRYGGDWYVLISNTVFPTLGSARESIAQLPDYNRLSEPFVKSIAQIKREISAE